MSEPLDLIARANDDCESLAAFFLGTPNKAMSSMTELRFGDTGKTSVTIAGLHRGKYRDWSDDAISGGGDMLDLIQREKSIDRAEAMSWLRTEWFSGSPIAPIDRKARAAKALEEAEEAEKRKAQKVSRAGDMWRASLPFKGTLAERYLVGRMGGREIPRDVIEGGALRWNPELRWEGGVGAMVALMSDPATNEPRGVHLTYIKGDATNVKESHGGKLMSVRRMHGRMGCVRLWPDTCVEQFLAIGEGIESTLAGTFQTGEFPAWAAINAGSMKAFPILAGLQGLRLFVDNDLSGTGQAAADECAARYWDEAGIQSRFFIPEGLGDFNDVLIGAVA